MRIKQFHFYLWILAFGFEPEEDEIQDEENGHESMFPETLYPWIKAVKKLPTRSSGCGLVSYNDVLFHMPLSLMIILNQSLRGGVTMVLSVSNFIYILFNVTGNSFKFFKLCVRSCLEEPAISRITSETTQVYKLPTVSCEMGISNFDLFLLVVMISALDNY